MGWDEEFLQQCVNTCTNDSGRIQDCPLFDIVSEDTARQCKMALPKALASEDVAGPIAKLPGGSAVTYGDGSSDGGSGGAPPPNKDPVPSLTYAPGERPSDSGQPLPGQIFKESSAYEAPIPNPTSNTPPPTVYSTLISSAIPAPPTPTVAAAEVTDAVPESSVADVPTTTPAPEIVPLGETLTFFSTQYVTNGNIVSKIVWQEALVTVTSLQDVTTTITITQGLPPPQRRRRAAHLHRHGHGHI
jgi:hypothetical protein